MATPMVLSWLEIGGYMELGVLEQMDETELRSYLEFLLWHYRVVDAFWFLKTEERFDQATAEDINHQVWGRVAGMAARDLKKRFNINGKGPERLCPGSEALPLGAPHRLSFRGKGR